MTRRKITFAAGATAALLTAAILIIAGCANPARPSAYRDRAASAPSERTAAPGDRPTTAEEAALADPIPAAAGDYVGSARCAGCHPREFKDHAATRHAATLRAVAPATMKILLPPVGPIPETPYRIAARAGRYSLAIDSRPPASQGLQFALGSGKSGITFVTPLPDGYLFEARYSYFPSLHRWYVTPGQEDGEMGDLGVDRTGAAARGCIECHSTVMPGRAATTEPRFYGVGCESCHGPGGAHARARHGSAATGGRMEALAARPPEKLNRLCGRCHRTVASLTNEFEKIQTHRFQPYALMKSACFVKTNGRLSCLTCHNPHRDAIRDARHYEEACLRCHGTAPAPANSAFTHKPCPVSPRSGCIPCHMPQRKAFLGTDLPTKMTDHFIGIIPGHR